jgi:hypothetical protein
VKLPFLYVQLDHAYTFFGSLGEVGVDVSLSIALGDDAVKASKAWLLIVFISFRFIIHLAIQLLTSEISTGNTNKTKNDPHSGCIRRYVSFILRR